MGSSSQEDYTVWKATTGKWVQQLEPCSHRRDRVPGGLRGERQGQDRRSAERHRTVYSKDTGGTCGETGGERSAAPLRGRIGSTLVKTLAAMRYDGPGSGSGRASCTQLRTHQQHQRKGARTTKRLAWITEGAHVASWPHVHNTWKRSVALPSRNCETGVKKRDHASRK